MNATRVSGAIAATAGVALLAVTLVAGVAAAVGGAWGNGTSTGAVTAPFGMGGGFMGPGPMMGGSGMGSGGMGSGGMGSGGMMGPGMGPRMMPGWGTSAGTSGAALPGATEVRVTATEFALRPAEIVLPAGTAVNVTLLNAGALPHDLTVPALGIRIVAAGGQTQTVGLRDLAAGSYAAYCSVSGHEAAGMRATVLVR